jgi:hypothetical protein
MEQAYIIDEITELLSQKLKEISSDDIPFDVVTSDIEGNEGDRHIRIYVLGVEPITTHNMQERLRRKDLDEDGKEYEFFVNPPAMLRVWYMLVPLSESMKESYRMLGLMIRHILDDGFIEVKECDWFGNEGDLVQIERSPDMNIDKQMQIFQQLNIDFRPALYYNLVIGVNSGKTERIRHVKNIDLRSLNKHSKRDKDKKRDDTDAKKQVTIK